MKLRLTAWYQHPVRPPSEPPKVEVLKTKMPTADVIPKQKQNVLVDDRGYVISDSADLTDPTNAKYILKSKKLRTDKYNEWLVTKDGRKYINEKDPVKAIKILEDNGMFPFSERSYTDTIEGIENTLEGRLKELGYKVKVKGSNLSNSSYLFVDDPYQNIDGFKIRLSDHELPPTYDRINGVPEFEISPKSNQHNYTQYTDPQKLIDKIQKDYPLSTVEATPTEPIATQPPKIHTADQEGAGTEGTGTPWRGQYDFVGYFSEGLATVELNGKWGFVDQQGKIVIPLEYDAVWEFRKGIAAVLFKGKRGFIDVTGREVVTQQVAQVLKGWHSDAQHRCVA